MHLLREIIATTLIPNNSNSNNLLHNNKSQ